MLGDSPFLSIVLSCFGNDSLLQAKWITVAFSCHLINPLRSCFARPRHQQYPVTDTIRGDLVWWKHFLQHYNGISVIPTNMTVSNPDLFACDACLDACGVVCFGEFFHAPFPPLIVTQKLNINQLELLTILVSLKLWHDRLCGCTVEILTDNQVSVYALTISGLQIISCSVVSE